MSFKDTQYDAIMDIYSHNQIENKILGEERRKEVYAAIPRIAEIDRTIASLAIDAARNRLKGDKDNMESTKKQSDTLLKEKEELLKSHGYTADYLKPIYTCPICRDTGIVDNDYCSCYKQAVISMLYKQSTLDKILDNENFDNFNLDFYSRDKVDDKPYTSYENMYNILNRVKAFVENFDNGASGKSFLFYGETGLGKTFLSNCIAKAMLDTRHTVLYQSSTHLFEDVCANALMGKGRDNDNRELYQYVFDCDLLIIDDLGTELTNSFVSSTLYDILNTRMRTGRSTVISTNLDLKEITERYSDRISTRIIASYEVFYFYGDNIRLAKRRQVARD